MPNLNSQEEFIQSIKDSNKEVVELFLLKHKSIFFKKSNFLINIGPEAVIAAAETDNPYILDTLLTCKDIFDVLMAKHYTQMFKSNTSLLTKQQLILHALKNKGKTEELLQAALEADPEAFNTDLVFGHSITTVLIEAIKSGHIRLALALIRKLPKESLLLQDSNGNSALNYAIYLVSIRRVYGLTQVSNELLQKLYGIKLNLVEDKQIFTNKKIIGKGYFGEVFESTLQDQTKIALKTCTDGHAKELLSEIEILTDISHPNIVAYYGVQIHSGKLYLMAEFIAGMDLFYFYNNLNTLSVEDHFAYAKKIYSIMRSILIFLFEHDIVHFDIKLENVMSTIINGSFSIKLIDFGIALSGKSKQIYNPRGTAGYVAPEIIEQYYKGAFPVDIDYKSDVFALGCMLFALATRNVDPAILPFNGKDDQEVNNKVLTIEPKWPKRDTSMLSQYDTYKSSVQDMMKKDPLQRPGPDEIPALEIGELPYPKFLAS